MASLARAMQGLCIRLAKRLNALAARSGAVFADRDHSHELEARREAANAVKYVLRNFEHHRGGPRGWVDPLSSARFVRVKPCQDAPVAAPMTWMLRVGWCDH